jgi:hypothetical protein
MYGHLLPLGGGRTTFYKAYEGQQTPLKRVAIATVRPRFP